MTNNFANQVSILSALWINYKEDKSFRDFVEYNDLGLPLAYFIDAGLVVPIDQAKRYVEETYDLLLASLQAEDKEYTSLEEMLGSVPLE
jgi:hypothetical protein